MKANQNMDALYDEIRQENLDDPRALPQKLLMVLNGGFVEEDQCVFLSSLKKRTPVKRIDFPDCTGYECFVNHIHVEDYLENGRPSAVRDVGTRLGPRAGTEGAAGQTAWSQAFPGHRYL